MASHQDPLSSRRATQQGKEQILGQRVKQSEEEISGLRKVIAAQATQLQLLDREITGVRHLYDKGLERLPRPAGAGAHASRGARRAGEQ